MKTLLRYYLINVGALWFTANLIPGFVYMGGFKTLLIAGAAFTVINIILVPLLKILLLPLNLLTLGFFAWVTNVLALYFLTRVVPSLQLTSFYFSGINMAGISIQGMDISSFWTAIIASLLIGLFTHFFHWLTH